VKLALGGHDSSHLTPSVKDDDGFAKTIRKLLRGNKRVLVI
jgi:hypothetical protein